MNTQNKVGFMKRNKKVLLTGASTAIASLSSVAVYAADHTALITTAATEGNGNVTAVITAVIGIAILSFGVGAMIAWFRK